MTKQGTFLLFSGRMFAGKDFVAKAVNSNIRGFADPIYQISDHFNGTSDKSVPGVRSFLQRVGQWGWGFVSEEYPHTVERAMFTKHMRERGHEVTADFGWVNWAEYGKRKDFWVNILLHRLGLVKERVGVPVDDTTNRMVAVTNARFYHELEPMRAAGFDHFHVVCSQETREERMRNAGYAIRRDEQLDTSEHMAMQFDQEIGDNQIVWNDHRPMPRTRNFMTIHDFRQRLIGAMPAEQLVA